MAEAAAGLIIGITLGFIFSWRLALVALGCSPFMMIGGALEAKMAAGFDKSSSDDYKEANLLAGDAIANYRTVASFATDDEIVKIYDRYLEVPN